MSPHPIRSTALLSAVVLLMLANACSTAGTAIDGDSVDKIQPGVTTQLQIERWFGQPTGVTVRASGGRRWRYLREEHTERSTRTVSRIGSFIAGLFGRWVPVAPVDVSYSNTIRHELVVLFHPDGIVQDYTYDRSETPRRSIR